jgi:hypothetical protein
MGNILKHLSANQIVGELIGREKYSFVEGKLIASIVEDVLEIVMDAAAAHERPPVTLNDNRRRVISKSKITVP